MQLVQTPKSIISNSLVDWLLEDNEPSVRDQTLTVLLDKRENDHEVVETRDLIGKRGWAARILENQKEQRFWDNSRSCYIPKFSAGCWQLAVLADLGVYSRDFRVRNAIEHLLDLHNVEDGGISMRPKGHEKFEPHICLTGNLVRALARMGYYEDDRVLKSVEWLISKQLPDGGWNCAPQGKHGSFMSTVQPVWALSEMMSHDAMKGWEVAAKRGSEFLLKHRVFKSDRDDSVILLDFLRLHYPIHYCYDFLHGLRVLTELGVKSDPRMRDAISLLLEKQLPDGKWLLEGVYRGWRHPNAIHGEETVGRPEERELITQGWGAERTLQLEEAGKPSKWITLQALTVLKRSGFLNLNGPIKG